MRDGSVIPYLDRCTNFDNILCTSYVMIDSDVKGLNCRLNNLLADFSHSNHWRIAGGGEGGLPPPPPPPPKIG